MIIQKALFAVLLLTVVAVLGISCDKETLLPGDSCLEAVIVRDTAYRVVYNECFDRTLWLEVPGDKNIGRDVEIYTPSPALTSHDPIKYFNVLEIPLPDFWKESNRRDTLVGRRIYIDYRTASEQEIVSIRHNQCSETYHTHNAPVIILTSVSFERCSDF